MRGDCLRMLLPPPLLPWSRRLLPLVKRQVSAQTCKPWAWLNNMQAEKPDKGNDDLAYLYLLSTVLIIKHRIQTIIFDCKQLITKKQIQPRVYGETWVLRNNPAQYWILCPGSVAWTWSVLSRPRSIVTSPWCYTGVRRFSSTTITFGDMRIDFTSPLRP